jgi:uncharacterized protein (TIGR02284 family)
MNDHDERWVLNRLIEMCRDEELSLRYAADHVRDQTVRTLLVELASQRARFAADLLPHAQRLGGAGTADGTTRGALHRRWMTLKTALGRSSDRAMITEAEHSEAVALGAYENALADMLPPTTRDLVERQCAEIRMAHHRVQGFLSH